MIREFVIQRLILSPDRLYSRPYTKIDVDVTRENRRERRMLMAKYRRKPCKTFERIQPE